MQRCNLLYNRLPADAIRNLWTSTTDWTDLGKRNENKSLKMRNKAVIWFCLLTNNRLIHSIHISWGDRGSCILAAFAVVTFSREPLHCRPGQTQQLFLTFLNSFCGSGWRASCFIPSRPKQTAPGPRMVSGNKSSWNPTFIQIDSPQQLIPAPPSVCVAVYFWLCVLSPFTGCSPPLPPPPPARPEEHGDWPESPHWRRPSWSRRA